MSMTHVVVGIVIKPGSVPSYLLVSSKKDFGEFSGYWYPPAGHVEKGEEELDALKRELEEEVGLAMSGASKIAVTEGDVKGQKTSWYRCEVEGYGLAINREELSAAGFFTRGEMEGMKLWPATQKVLEEHVFGQVKKILVVDDQDRVVGSKPKDALQKEDRYRVSALWLTNSLGEILLARRHRTKSHHPFRWGPAVAGTVEDGETYGQNMAKEIEEEIGLRDLALRPGPKTKTDREYRYFTQWYTATLDQPAHEFKIQPDEVEEVRWFSPQELRRGLERQPGEFLPRMGDYLELFSSLK